LGLVENLLAWAKEVFVPYGEIGLFIVAFVESSVFPIPPDIVLISLGLINPNLSLLYALISTIGSVLGGVAGYYIGLKGGRRVAERLFSKKVLDKVDNYFKEYGSWAVLIAAFSPIPYKVFTITSGIAKLNLKKFIIASIIGRGARFVSEGITIMFFGKELLDFALANFELLSIIISVAIIIFIIIRKKMIIKR
jgi:undecaprenyl-diphosphatase